tara:strand:- start:1373 stop:2233 length:861 start_codon:yes stop_codon:yes gene_type:complete
MKNYEQIETKIEDKALIISLSRPEKLNAFTEVMMREIIDAVNLAEENNNIRAIIFTGKGEKYCAGADLSTGEDSFNWTDKKKEAKDIVRDAGGVLTLRLFKSTKPIIGAINGDAVGIGATMLLPMDVRIASDNARFGFVFAKRGIVPEAASSWFLPRLIGIDNALKLCYSANVIDAKTAKEINLISEITSQENLISRALQISDEFTKETSSISIALTRQMLWRMMGADHPMEAHKIDSRAVYALGKSGEAVEGIKSFFEKRPPEFPGKITEDMPDFYPWWDEKIFE